MEIKPSITEKLLDPFDTQLYSLLEAQDSPFLDYGHKLVANSYRKTYTTRGGFWSNWELLLLMELEKTSNIMMCGCNGHMCNQYRMCEQCANRRARSLWARYNEAWNKGKRLYWYSVTYSHSSAVKVGAAYFKRQKQAVEFTKKLTKQGVIQGAILQQEVAIASIVNGELFPHAHIIMCSKDQALDETISEMNLPVGTKIMVHPLFYKSSFVSALVYPNKAINLDLAFRGEWDGNNLPELIALGKKLFTNLRSAEKSNCVQRVTYTGCMHNRNPNFMGKLRSKKNVNPTMETVEYNREVKPKVESTSLNEAIAASKPCEVEVVSAKLEAEDIREAIDLARIDGASVTLHLNNINTLDMHEPMTI